MVTNTTISIYKKQTLKKLRYSALFAAAFVGFFHVHSQVSNAADVQIDAGVTFLKSLSLVAEQLELGVFSFSDNAGANDIIIAAATGNITCSNTAEYTCPASGNPGKLGISGSEGALVDISCAASATMSNGNTAFDIEDIRMNISSSEMLCSGFGSNVKSHVLSNQAEQNEVKLGAKLVIPSSGVTESGEYSTAQSGGTPIAIQVLYQ